MATEARFRKDSNRDWEIGLAAKGGTTKNKDDDFIFPNKKLAVKSTPIKNDINIVLILTSNLFDELKKIDADLVDTSETPIPKLPPVMVRTDSLPNSKIKELNINGNLSVNLAGYYFKIFPDDERH
ncbi:hypothetical protein CEXT_780031 [Caerostris extrusa]|uniref:Uncharacterized protein n=1 Tax=Caerostris extrusa TaxID=172846 RepID=A0AAV4X7C8_CAEEX|nr:hypothetical protein CEXT_780031 [Caerostris extrusa]